LSDLFLESNGGNESMRPTCKNGEYICFICLMSCTENLTAIFPGSSLIKQLNQCLM
jgi:hypothetical protein